jgi:hypothetical protein
LIEIIGFLAALLRPCGDDETILPRDETTFRFWRRTPETPHGYQVGNGNGRIAPTDETGDG